MSPAADAAAAPYPPAVAPSRRILREGTFNARDAGCYPVGPQGERRMVAGRFFRSDALSHLTPADVAEAGGLGIRLVVDLRDSHERDNAPDVQLPGAENISVKLYEDTLLSYPADNFPSLPEFYGKILTTHRHKLIEAIDAVAQVLPAPVIVHCTAGKDRTGLVIAMIQDISGVAHHRILEDYAASQQLLNGDFARRLEQLFLDAELDVRQMGEPIAVPVSELDATLHDLRTRYGSIAGYLEAGGLSRDSVERLREHLVQDWPASNADARG